MKFFNKKHKNEDQSDTPKYKEGFDNPLSNPDDDQLDRKRLVNQVYPYLVNLEPDWSVRVGLLARWGEGKTTVCRWVAQKAEKDGHIPVWFSPWSAKTDAQLWAGFYTALTSALINHGKQIRLSRTTLKHMLSSLTNRGWAEQIGNLHQAGQSGINVVQSLSKMNEKDVSLLYAHMKGKRFIVIIDDLDRVDPNLIPQLLMTIRDVLDLEGFSFLLPFDDKIVSDALTEYNKAKGFGENFLEKILDFRVRLDSVTKDQTTAFFKNEMKLHCPFVPDVTLQGLEDYLPTNPRKLKALVRGMRVFEAEAIRHREGEIDWKALIFAQMIQLESEVFLGLYVSKTFADDTSDSSGSHPWIIAAMERDEGKAKKDEEDRIKALLDKAEVSLEQKREQLIKLCEGWRQSYGLSGKHKITYALRLLNKPETLTWAEFDAFWKLWSKTTISQHYQLGSQIMQTEHKNQKAEMVREVLITLSQQYDLHLEKAGSVALLSEQARCVENAKEILVLYEHFLENEVSDATYAEILTIDVFGRLIGVIEKWFHFTGNQADRDLREDEGKLLKQWVQKACTSGLNNDYYTLLAKLDNDRYGTRTNADDLYAELLSIAGAEINQNAHEILEEKEGINKIFPNGVEEGSKKVLLDPESPAWTPNGASPMENMLLTSETNPLVQANAREFLDLLRKGSNQGTWELNSEQICKFYDNPSLVVAIWNAAIATELQFRRLKETLDIRSYLISRGIDEEMLRVPEWLAIAQDENEQETGAD